MIYAIELDVQALSASRTLERRSGHCIHKSVLFVAGLRALGVPARLGLARVRNHLATEKLERRLGTDVLVPWVCGPLEWAALGQVDAGVQPGIV